MPGELQNQLEFAIDDLNAQRNAYVIAKAQWLQAALVKANYHVRCVEVHWKAAHKACMNAETKKNTLWYSYVGAVNAMLADGSDELTDSQCFKLDKLYSNWALSKNKHEALAGELHEWAAGLKNVLAFRASLPKAADAKFDAKITRCLLKAMRIASQLNAEEPDFENETTDSLEGWEHAAPSAFPPEVLCSNASPEELPASAGSAVTATGCKMGDLLQGE